MAQELLGTKYIQFCGNVVWVSKTVLSDHSFLDMQ